MLFTLASPALAGEKGSSKTTSKAAKPAKTSSVDKPAAKPKTKGKTPKGSKAKPSDAQSEEAKTPPDPETAVTPPAPEAEAPKNEEAKPEEPKPVEAEPAPPPPPQAAAEPARVSEPKVYLHVESPTPVTIETNSGEAVCTSPCDQLVPAASLYRVGGQRPSKPFVLEGKNGHAKISVDPATNRDFYTGVGVLGGGGALAIAGGIVTAVAYGMRSDAVPGIDGTQTDTSYTDGMTVGVTMMVAGIAAGIWGGATMLSNRETTVSGHVQKPPPARGKAPNAITKAAGLSAPTFFVPVFGGTF